MRRTLSRRLGRGLRYLLVGLVDGPHVLASPVRLRILIIIQDKPGITLREIATRIQLSWATTKYHVLRLETAGHVRTVAIGGRRVCLPREGDGPLVVAGRALLAEPSARRIAAFLAAHPGAGVGRVIEETGFSQRVVYHHVKRLVDHGLARPEPGYGYRRLHPTPALYEALV